MKIQAIPIASDSLGVRSMAYYIETPDIRVIFDAGVSLGPRFGLPPHPLEYKALDGARKRLRSYAARAEAITISHYHFDHYTPTWKTLEAKWTWSCYDEARMLYVDRDLYVKDYRSSINYSQRKRGYIFNKIVKDFAKNIYYADSMSYRFGDTLIQFKEPTPHGEVNSPLGYVLCILVRYEDDALMYCPDVQGPISKDTLNIIVKESPRTLIIGGPPIYLSSYKVSSESIREGLKSLAMLASKIQTMIIDHHILRDESGLEEVRRIRSSVSKRDSRILTAAEYIGLKNSLLEARRQHLYEENPPSQEFQKWMKLSPLRQRSQPPPL